MSRYYTARAPELRDYLLEYIRSEEPPVSLGRLQMLAARRLGASRSAVEEALAELEARRDVTSRPEPGSER